MMRGMRKKLDEVLQENARNGQSIPKPNLSIMDNDIITTFHNNDVLETVIEKTKPNTKVVQLPKLMGEPLQRLTSITLQQGVS